MKGAYRPEVIIGEENLEWIEQHHRNTSHKSVQNLSQNHLAPASDNISGDESDSAERQRQSHFYTPDPHKRTKEYHIDQAIQAIQLLKAASRPAGWKKVLKHKSGCLVYQSTGNGDKHPAFKGEHVVRGYRAQDVFSVVGVRKLWDDWYDELSCVESYDSATNLMYMVMKGTLSSKTRDISMVERIEMEPDGTIYFASCSVESSKIPRISGKVRADIFVAGWIIQPLPSNPPITKITYVIQTDLLSRLPKFIARRALAKRPLVITTIETHLRKNGVPMMMSNLVSQTTNRHRSLSEPLKPEKFLFAEPEPEEKVQSGSAFLSPLGPITSDKDVEQLEDRNDSADDEDMQLTMATATEASTARNSRNSLAPSLMSNRSLAPSIFTPDFLENNAMLGDTALFGDSQLFGKGGIFESTLRRQDEMSVTSTDDLGSDSPQLAQKHYVLQERARLPPPPNGTRPTPSDADIRRQQSIRGVSAPTQHSPESRSVLTTRSTHLALTERPGLPHVVTPATPPLTPTTSVDGKDATSDSDASLTPHVRIIPRAPKQHVPVDTSLPARPSSMAFAAFGMRSPSDIMESRRHSTLITRSSSFAPRHSHVIPMRGNPAMTLQSMNRTSMLIGQSSNAMTLQSMNRTSMLIGQSSNAMTLQSMNRTSMLIGQSSNAMKRQSMAPSLDSNRSSTQLPPTLALPHRHSETARKALAMFKVLASSPEDRWRAVSSEGTFKSYSRVISGAGLPMLRGEGVITGGWTVEQINAVIESSGCRHVWDERFENMSIAETFNSNEYLFHVSLQGIGSLTGRDLAGVTIIDRDPQTSALYNVSTSVLDATIPEDPGRIRALLELSGWSLRPIFDGQGNTLSVNITFVIQIDIRGTLPNSVVKSISASMMTAVPRLNQFINRTGYPPYASHISGTRLLDTFDPKTGYYELCFKTSPGWTEVRVGRKVYKDGYDFFIKPDDPTVRVELAPDFGGVRIWTTLDHEGQSITAQVSRKGQNQSSATAKQQLLRLQQEEEEEAQQQQQQQQLEENASSSEGERTGRRKRESPLPMRPRDSRVFESGSPVYGGPSLRKSSSHLKSNDQIPNAEQVDDGFSASAGGGSDLRPYGASLSIGRERRSASFTPLSAFDPNIVVASSSARPDDTPQASMAPKASQGSERSRSRSRTPRSLVNVPAGAPSPPLPRRSSSLSRYSIPILPYLPQADAPPLPFNASLTSPTFGNAYSKPSILSRAQPADTLAVSTTAAVSPTTTTPPSASATTHSPISSPTLGPFHVPICPVEAIESLDKLPSEPSTLPKGTSSAISSKDDSSKASILQPAAEIPSCTQSSESRVCISAVTVSPLSSDIITVSLAELDKEGHTNVTAEPKFEAQKPELKLGLEQRQAQQQDVSLAFMSSPLSSPLPALTRTANALEPINRLKHSCSTTSIGGTRRVTFSPDVVDNSENRSPPSRTKKSPKRKLSNSSATSPLSNLQNLKVEDIDSSEKGSLEEAAMFERGSKAQIFGEVPRFGTVATMDEEAYESDEAEFVEAHSDLSEAIDETVVVQTEMAATTNSGLSQTMEKRVRVTAEKPTMEMDHLQDYGDVWRMAIESFIEELNSSQIRIAAVFVVLMLLSIFY